MIKYIIAFLFLMINLYGVQTLQPDYSLKAKGDVQDIVYGDNKLYAVTSEGTIDIFDLSKKELLQRIELPSIKDFMGDVIPAKIYSIDLFNGQIVVVSQGMKGYRNLWLYKGEKLAKLISIEKKLFIKKARFISKNKILMATLSNEIIMYDIPINKKLYRTQVSHSSFSDFTLNEDKSKVILSDESGIVRLIETDSGNTIKKIGSENLDRVYQLDYKKGITLTAGQDRKAVVYRDNGSDSLEFHFLLYSCGLSPSGKVGAVAYNEKNDVVVFDTKTMDKLYYLVGNKATLTKILFVGENGLFATSDNEQINFYKF